MLRNNISLTIPSWLIWRWKTLQNNWTYSRCSNESLIPSHAHSHIHTPMHTRTPTHTHINTPINTLMHTHTHTQPNWHTPAASWRTQLCKSLCLVFLSFCFNLPHLRVATTLRVSEPKLVPHRNIQNFSSPSCFHKFLPEPLLWLLIDLTTQPIWLWEKSYC